MGSLSMSNEEITFLCCIECEQDLQVSTFYMQTSSTFYLFTLYVGAKTQSKIYWTDFLTYLTYLFFYSIVKS